MTGNSARAVACSVLAGWVVALGTMGAPRAFAAEPKYETIHDVVYATPDGEPLKADIYRPTGEGPFPGVLCIHGGAWLFGGKTFMSTTPQKLAEAGYTAVSINYRLAPKYKFPAQIDDCRTALAWMRANAKQYKIDPKRLGAWGYSAGGHLAALLGVSDQGLKVVVAGGTPCDLRGSWPSDPLLAFWLGGTRKEMPDVYKAASPASFVSPDDPPMFFYHGQYDAVVPLTQPMDMAAALGKAGVKAEVHVIPMSGHVATKTNRDIPAKGIKFLDKYLRPR